MRPAITMVLAGAALFASASPARADIRSKAARETAEYVMRKFGVKAVEEGSETLARRITTAAARHGDDVFAAVRRVGPKALALADEAGEQAPRALRLLSRHGDDAAVWLLKRPKSMRLLSRFGDDAAEVLVKHKGLAEPVLDQIGGPAVKALGAIGPQGGRRLAMMAEGGELAALGHTPELMEVISRHGDVAMDFIWKHKGALAVGTTLTAFLANPKPFLDGTNQLAGTVGETAVKPVVQAASGLIWALLALVALVLGGGAYLAIRYPKAAGVVAKLAFELIHRK